MAKILYIPNKFIDKSYEHDTEASTVADALGTFIREYPQFQKPMRGKKVLTSINGELLHRENWDTTTLESTDVVEITHSIEGGDLGFGGFLSFNPMDVVNTVLYYGGGWLLDLFDFDMELEGEEGSTYSWEGPTTQTRQNQPVAVVYGEHLLGGQYINFNIFSEGSDNYLDLQLALCEGEIAGIMLEDETALTTPPGSLEIATTQSPYVKLNDQFIDEYEDAYWACKVGTNTQTSITGFKTVQTVYDFDHPLPAENDSPGGKWSLLYTTNAEIDEYTIKYKTPGMYKFSKKGKMKSAHCNYRIRDRIASPQGSWTYHPYNETGGDWYTIKGKSKSEILEYKSLVMDSRDTYDIQTQRYTPASSSTDTQNRYQTTHVIETVHEDLNYPNTAILAVRVKATDQISGTFPSVSMLVRGLLVRVPDLAGNGSAEFNDYYWTGTDNDFRKLSNDDLLQWDGSSYVTQWSNNPAYILRDFLTNTRYGLGDVVDANDLDDVSIDTTAKKCWQKVEGTHKNGLNIVMDSKTNPGDALNQMAKVSRIILFWSSGYIKFKYEEDESPIQLFTMGNIVQDKFNTQYELQSKLPNIIEVQFADKDDGWKQATRELVDEAEWALSKPHRKITLSLKGVTDSNQALREAKLALNKAKLKRRSIKFSTTMGAIHCEPGDIVAFQHDVPQWGWGGRAISGTSTTIVIDQEVPAGVVSDPTAYDVKVEHDDDSIETFDILSVSGKTITIDGTWSTIPEEDDLYIVGVEDSSIKEYRVRTVTFDIGDAVKIDADEHLAAMYSDTGYSAGVSDESSELPNPSESAPAVTNLNLYQIIGGDVGVGVSFRQPESTLVFDHADIYMSTDNEHYVKVSEGYGDDDVELINLLPGIVYYIKVYSINKIGIKNRDPAEGQITLDGSEIGFPSAPTGLEVDDGGVGQGLDVTFAGKNCKVVWRLNAPYGGAGSLEPEMPAGQGAQSSALVQDFIVQVWDPPQVNLLREEITTDRFYSYTYDKNYEDNDSVPRRTFAIKVYQRSYYNKISEQPAVILVNNPAPTMATHTPDLSSIYRGVTVDFRGYTVTDNDMDYYKIYYGYQNPPTGSVDHVSWRTQSHAVSGLAQLTKVFVQLEPFDAFGVGTKSVVASGRTDGFDFVDASINEWTIKADAVVASIIRNNAIDETKIAVASLAAIQANLGRITAGYIDGVIITGGVIQTAQSGKRVVITDQGIMLAVTAETGGYGDVRYGDNPASNASVFFGSGALAYIHHIAESVPFYISAEQTVGDFHYFNRGSDPSGLAEIGDVCVVNGSLKICTSGGTPGNWTVVGGQS